MVTVYFGLDGKAVKKPDELFNTVYKPEWFNDSFVRNMVRGIDNTVVESEYCMRSPVFGQIAPTMLSGGLKACILILKSPNYYIDLVACGENCEPWLAEIFKMSDAHVAMSGAHLGFEDYDIHCICENDGEEITTWQEWCRKMTDYEDIRNMPEDFKY